MKTYALDTNIISFLMNNDINVKKCFKEALANGDRIVIPPIAYYEIKRGLLHNLAPRKEVAFLEMCKLYEIVDIKKGCYDKAAEIYAYTRKIGKSIEDADILIAALCIVNDYVLVTDNQKHFADIKDLSVDNWC